MARSTRSVFRSESPRRNAVTGQVRLGTHCVAGNEYNQQKRLLSVKEFREYVGIGESKARQLLHNQDFGFGVRIGNRLFADKMKVDRWLDSYAEEV